MLSADEVKGIENEIESIVDLGQYRKEEILKQAGHSLPFELVPNSFNMLTDDEKGRLHVLKQSLPSAGDIQLKARERNIARRLARKIQIAAKAA
jgi:hypothetical protein